LRRLFILFAFLPLLHFVQSGYWESNPDYKTPSLAYYHYTIARFGHIARI
jgi:hypothetical protein